MSMVLPETGSLYTNSKIEKALENKLKNNQTNILSLKNSNTRRKESLFIPKTPYEGVIANTGLMQPVRFSGYKEKGKNKQNHLKTSLSSQVWSCF